jgi:Skp family chaperone for outer membrane proteins
LRRITILVALLSACTAIPAQPQSPGATATVRFQTAIVNTAEGRRTAMCLQEQMAPQLAALEKKKADIEEMRRKLDQESKRKHGIWPFRRRMSRRHKAMLEAEIAQMARAAQRERDDDRAALERERLRIMDELGKRMKTVLEKYAREHGYSIIIDSGSPQIHILVSKNDLTDEIVRLYDLTYPAQP